MYIKYQLGIHLIWVWFYKWHMFTLLYNLILKYCKCKKVYYTKDRNTATQNLLFIGKMIYVFVLLATTFSLYSLFKARQPNSSNSDKHQLYSKHI